MDAKNLTKSTKAAGSRSAYMEASLQPGKTMIALQKQSFVMVEFQLTGLGVQVRPVEHVTSLVMVVNRPWLHFVSEVHTEENRFAKKEQQRLPLELAINKSVLVGAET